MKKIVHAVKKRVVKTVRKAVKKVKRVFHAVKKKVTRTIRRVRHVARSVRKFFGWFRRRRR